MDLKHKLIAAGLSVISTTKMDRLLRPIAQGAGVVLMFHRIRPYQPKAFEPNRFLEVEPAFFEQVLKLLREDFDIISMDELPERLSQAKAKRPFATLTFDDGFRDNIEYAWPILKRHNAPFTIYVVRDYAQGRGHMWWRELEEIIDQADQLNISFEGEVFSLATKTIEQKQAAFKHLAQWVKSNPEPKVRRFLEQICKQAGLDHDQLVQEECAGWDDLKALAKDPLVTIGAHSLSHPRLHSQQLDQVTNEIFESKKIIEEQMGRSIRHFAYPFGDKNSAQTREFQLAQKAGYASAVTTHPGHLFQNHADHLTSLPRLSINGLHQSEKSLRALFSGVPFMAQKNKVAS